MITIQRIRSAAGMTLAETTVILSVSGLLAGATAPAVADYVTEARYSTARQDTHVVAASFARFSGDVATQSSMERGWATFDLLASAGDVPIVGGGGDSRWVAASGTATIGSLDDHMVTNVIGYRSSPWRQVTGIRGWHGPYVEAGIGSDPWGRRYAINVGAQGNIVVLSAGPNGLVETAFQGNAIVPGGDDIIALVSSGS